MIGIPYRLVRQGDSEVPGPSEKVVYLATRRSGEAGESMKQAKRDFRKAQMATVKAAQNFRTLNKRIEELPADHEKLDALIADREEASDEMLTHHGEGVDAAEKLVRLSLVQNYGADGAEDILNQCTEDDLEDMVVTIQTGEQPSDFMQRREAPERSTSTSQPDASPSGSSSSADSASSSSSAAKSG